MRVRVAGWRVEWTRESDRSRRMIDRDPTIFGVPAFRSCWRCRIVVENVMIERDGISRDTTVITRCHGEAEAITIAREAELGADRPTGPLELLADGWPDAFPPVRSFDDLARAMVGAL